MTVVQFVGFGSSDGILRNVFYGGIDVALPSPSLRFGSATFTSAFVSENFNVWFFFNLVPYTTKAIEL